MAKEKDAIATVAIEDARAWMGFKESYGKRKNVDFGQELLGLISKLERHIRQNHPKAEAYAARREDLLAALRGGVAMGEVVAQEAEADAPAAAE